MLETLNTINSIEHHRNAVGLGFTYSSVNSLHISFKQRLKIISAYVDLDASFTFTDI